MQRYLLFDAGCSVCNQLARAIEEAAGSKLEAVSIRERQAVKWLDRAYPSGWEHQPYLVTVDGERVRACAGTGMAVRLGWLLGPRKAWRVWNLARQYGVVWPAGEDFSAERRGFLKRAGLFVGGLFFFPRFGSPGGQGRGPAGGAVGDTRTEPVTGKELKALKDRALNNSDVQRALGVTRSKPSDVWSERVVGFRTFTQEGESQQILLPLRTGGGLALAVFMEVILEGSPLWTGVVVVDHSGVYMITQGNLQQIEGEEAARLQRILQNLEQELAEGGSAPQSNCSFCCDKAALFCATCGAGLACGCAGPCLLLCAACPTCLSCDYNCGYCIGSNGESCSC